MIKKNIETIRAQIAISCQKCSKPISEITLLAVSKTVNAEIVEQAIAAGHFNFAENKVQELVNKKHYFSGKNDLDLKWHFIGHLQSNKVKSVVDNADLFHCLDSVKLAAKINDYCSTQDKVFEVLIQINSSGEDSKSGITAEQYPLFLKELDQFRNIRIRGLMSIGKFNAEPEESRPEFRLMKELFDLGSKIGGNNCDFKYLSMGMSHDFGVAIEEGANIIRVGTAIFGERDYLK